MKLRPSMVVWTIHKNYKLSVGVRATHENYSSMWECGQPMKITPQCGCAHNPCQLQLNVGVRANHENYRPNTGVRTTHENYRPNTGVRTTHENYRPNTGVRTSRLGCVA